MSNHPPHIKKNLPRMISERISKLSSNDQVFNQGANLYNEGLKQAGYRDKIQFVQTDPGDQPRRSRGRNIIYFHPPWNDALATNLGRRFLEIVDSCFQRGTPFHKLFNRNNVKISYSCTKNIRAIISSKNNKLLNPKTNTDINQRQCNCQPVSSCPVGGKCLKESLVYSCKVESNLVTKQYIGVTKNSFKERWNGHNYDARHIQERHRTTLANYVWTLTEQNIPFTQTWSIETHGQMYSPEIGYCNGCSIEKYLIFKYFRTRNLTNCCHELCFKCVYAKRYLLTNNRALT